MTTDFVEDNVTITEPGAPPTRWEAGPLDLGDEHGEQERGGIILTALVALLLPLIVAAAVFLPGSATDDPVATDRGGGTGLDDIAIDPAPVRSEIPDPGADVASEVQGRVEAAVTERPPTDPSPGAGASTTILTPPTIDASPATIAARSTVPSAGALASTDTPSSTVSPGSTAPETATAPSTTSADPATTIPTTTSPATTATPPTTVAPEPATTLPTVPVDPSAFLGRVEIGQIGENFVRYRFTAETTTSYAVVVRDGNEIIATTAGTAVGGEVVSKSANGLTPGTDYTVRVRLFGPPEALSVPVAFRTNGGEPDPSDVPVEILDAAIVDVSSTRLVVNYRTNVCSNGSFVIRESDGGEVVGRNGGQNGGCLFRHSAEPGFWTPPLEPGTAYELTIWAEAGGRGQGDGNMVSLELEVTTTG